MKKSENNLELRTLKNIIEYSEKHECFVVRIIERNKDKYFIENWDEEIPKIIRISKELYLKCLHDSDFDFANNVPQTTKEFYLRYRDNQQ